VLRGTIDGSYTGWKFNVSDLARMKFKGVRYVDQDGILSNKGGMGGVEPGTDHTSVGVTPPPAAEGVMWDGEQEPTATRKVGLGLEGVPTDNRHPAQAVELIPVDFFADPFVLFSGPSSTGFTGIGDQRISREATNYLFGNL